MRVTAIVLATITLAGCSGGGGSSSSSTSTTQTSSATTQSSSVGPSMANTTISGSVTLLTSVPTAATGFTSSGDPAVDSLVFVNYQRAQVGMPAIVQNAALATVATNHSVYLFDNTEIGHYETAGRLGYTGNSPNDRITAVYSANATGEILIAYQGIAALPNSYQPIESLFEAPFHRGVALFDYAVGGVGYKQSGDTTKITSLTMDFAGQQNALGSSQMIAYPYNGQTNVETSWYASESPSPFEANPSYDNTVVGYPILLTGGIGATLTVSSFTLRTAAGVSVACQEMDESVDSEAAGMATCTPYAQLTPSTSYIATAVGTMTKDGMTQNFNLQWEFTTASSVTVPMDSPSRLSAAATLSAVASQQGTSSASSGSNTQVSTQAKSIALPSPQRHFSQ